MTKKLGFGLLVGCLLAVFSLAVPRTSLADMQAVYQVFLVDSEGAPVSVPVTVTVGFYDSASGGSPYWSETQTVTPSSGLCIIDLGKTNSFNLSFDRPYYLGVQIDGSSNSTARLLVQGPGSYSQAGEKANDQSLNVKYEWLDINAQ